MGELRDFNAADTCGRAFDECEAIRDANQDRDCARENATCRNDVELACADNAVEQCCDEDTRILERANVKTDDLMADFMCGASDTLPTDVWNELMTHYPNGCSTNRLGLNTQAGSADLPNYQGEPFSLGPDSLTTDLDGDGEPDLLNECMYWNCQISPGSRHCSLRALGALSPQADQLACEAQDWAEVEENPDEFLSQTRVALSRNFYNRVFLDRRFPRRFDLATSGDVLPLLPTPIDPALAGILGIPDVAPIGSFSLGGPVANGVYVAADTISVVADALDSLRNPIGYAIGRCGLIGDPLSPECQLQTKVQILHATLITAIATVSALAGALAAVPFPAAQFASIALQTVAATLGATVAMIDVGVIPGFTRPLRGMRAELLDHLQQNWYDRVIATANKMSGNECETQCGIPCTEHRFLAAEGFFDWAIEAVEITEELDCLKYNAWNELGDGNVSLDTIIGGAFGWAEFLACETIDIYYRDAFKQEVVDVLQREVLNRVAGGVCGLSTFYLTEARRALGPQLIGPNWENSCVDAVKAFFGHSSGDPHVMIEAMRDLVATLETAGEKEAAEWALRVTTGIEVDLDDFTDTFGTPEDPQAVSPVCTEAQSQLEETARILSKREMMHGAFALQRLDDASERVDNVNRQLGNYELQTQNPTANVPLDWQSFYPVYNTIQMNKLALMGDGDVCADFQTDVCADNPTLCSLLPNVNRLLCDQEFGIEPEGGSERVNAFETVIDRYLSSDGVRDHLVA